MRLFVAVNFNTDTRNRLIKLREELRSRSCRGNFTLDDNLHLTLAFIGEVDERQAEKVINIIGTVKLEPFLITVERLGTFSRGTLWWAGLQKDSRLIKLQQEIEYKLALGGFKMDGREYHPHITLGREVVTKSHPWQIDRFGETVNKIDIMKSERIGGRLVYTSIYCKIN